MGQEESRPRRDPQINLTIDSTSNHELDRARREAEKARQDSQRSRELLTQMIMFVMAIPIGMMALTWGFSFIWCLFGTIHSYVWLPLVSFGYWLLDTILPYWFVVRCSLSGYWPGHCWSLTYYYPYGFLQKCRALGIGGAHCWDLVQRFPHDFTYHCWSNLGFSAQECWRLAGMIG